ncbi:hypothetical protein FOA52_003772 [Chlamydomonas sp. UWO 241]|nr:hypothetical protein FOA52_003772 [Chlamydomonas sp. UWO 241]
MDELDGGDAWDVEVAGEEEEQGVVALASADPRGKGAAPGTDDVVAPKKKIVKRKKKVAPIRINLSACKYEVLRIVQRKLGWKEVGDDDEWEVYWTDTSITIDRIVRLSRTQKINHFNGMLELCRKRAMARNLMKLQKVFPEHFDFFPQTFVLPGDLQLLVDDVKARGKKQFYILKPDAGCQGKGIRLMQGGKEETLQKVLSEMGTLNIVAQHYLPEPYLINGFKFDLRIYALVVCVDPLRVFVYKEGLVRICTEQYVKPKASNVNLSFMHLTNYAINKKNEEFVANNGDSDDASKLSLEQLQEYMEDDGHDWGGVWASIHGVIVKSLASVQPGLKNNYRSAVPIDNDGFSCFEILGYDIMLDTSLRPWLIECNHSSSFNIDSPLDLAIKEALVTDTLDLVRIDPKLIARTKKAEKKAAGVRLLEPLKALAAKAKELKDSSKAVQQQQQQQGSAHEGSAEAGGSAGGGASGGGGAASGGAGAGSDAAGGSGSAGGALPTTIKASADVLFRPRNNEELEAWRAGILCKRERYEAKHSGGFTRIYPVDDAALQATYDKLLRGSEEVSGNAFGGARVGRKGPMGPDWEERRKKEAEESEAGKAERVKVKAQRDKLAQQALERRRLREAPQPQPSLGVQGGDASGGSGSNNIGGGGTGTGAHPLPFSVYEHAFLGPYCRPDEVYRGGSTCSGGADDPLGPSWVPQVELVLPALVSQVEGLASARQARAEREAGKQRQGEQAWK